MSKSKGKKQYSHSEGLPKELTAEQVKWAWAKCVEEKPQSALMEGIPLMCAEVMQTNEIGMITAGGRQISIVRHLTKREPGGFFEIIADQDFHNVSWSHLFKFFKMSGSGDTSAAAIVSGFELLLYRPSRGQLYTPLKYSSYDEAVKGCDRHLFFLLSVLYEPSTGSFTCIAQVDEPILRAVFENKISVDRKTLLVAVDSWLDAVYNEDMAEERYRALSEFPLAEPPADSDEQSPITTIQLDNADW